MLSEIIAVASQQYGNSTMTGQVEDRIDRLFDYLIDRLLGYQIDMSEDIEIKGFVKGIRCAFVSMTMNEDTWEHITYMLTMANRFMADYL